MAFVALALWLGVGPLYAQCDCGTPPNKVSTGQETFFKKIYQYKIPDLTKSIKVVRDEPIAFDLIVDANGRPCSAVVVRTWSDTASNVLKDEFLKWRFTPAGYQGRNICMASRVLVYLRVDAGRVKLLFPGLNDAPAH